MYRSALISRLTCLALGMFVSACTSNGSTLDDSKTLAPTLPYKSADFVEFNPRPPVSNMWFVTGNGRLQKLRQFKGKTVLLNYWAPWCAPCRKELPTIERLQIQLQKEEFVAIAVSSGKGGFNAARKFADEIGLSQIEIWADPEDKTREDLPIRKALPMTILIDKNRNMIGYHLGFLDWNSSAAVRLVKHYMSED